MNLKGALPGKHGLYDPAFEKDSCGVGFICDIKGRPSRSIIEDALTMNSCMSHRGGVGYEKNTGDGAGILIGMPDRFFRKAIGTALPSAGLFGVGNVFLPADPAERAHCKALMEREVADAGQTLVAWREVPVDPVGADLGNAARSAMPHIEQLIVGANGVEGQDFERKLYLIRKHGSSQLRSDPSLVERKMFYICSLSSRVIVYKGMLTPDQVAKFYQDLNDVDFESHLAMVH
jgi:glutamate synthase (NADPH/NADH) large chain